MHVSALSDKLGRVFNHNSKGVMVVSSRLQSGAENVAKNYGMGIVKFDDRGLDIIADRSGRSWAENDFVKSQIFVSEKPPKSLKFSAFHNGKFFGDIDRFIQSFDSHLKPNVVDEAGLLTVPYLTESSIKHSVLDILKQVDYQGGRVDLEKICAALSIELEYTSHDVRDADGNPILGSANFTRNLISININENEHRERFTLAHEIGHFCLQHKAFLNSESIIERDLVVKKQSKNTTKYERLEIQANTFAANLILPDYCFEAKTAEFRRELNIQDRGHGYIFVDSQPCNFMPYEQLLSDLSSYFEVSKQAVEIKFKTSGMLTDQRKKHRPSTIGFALQNLLN
jgi:Zn-dependent peptidase ImmA (M78 family)